MRKLVSLLALALASCIVPEDASPGVQIDATIASKFIHRGMVQNDKAVLQPSANVALPVKSLGTFEPGEINVGTWANMDLTNDTGNAWFPDGHAGKFSQIDYVGDYTQPLGPVDVTLGVHNYNLPNGTEFPFGERGATSELFMRVSGQVLGATPALDIRYDFDEVNDWYFRGSLREDFEIGSGFSVWAHGWVAYARRGQSDWLYGVRKSGWADIGGEIGVDYSFDERTVIGFKVAGTTILDSTISDWFDVINIDSSNIWVGGSVSWVF